MKKLNFLCFFFSLSCLVLLSESCKEDTCPAITCNTGTQSAETCKCVCPEGFSGTNCEIEDMDMTEPIPCLNGSVFEDGVCKCEAGFEGDECETLWRSKYINDDYLVESSCDPGVFNPGKIKVDDSDDFKMILEFEDTLENVGSFNAVVLTTTTFDVPEQAFVIGMVSGSGSIDANGVVKVTLTTDFETCELTYTPQ